MADPAGPDEEAVAAGLVAQAWTRVKLPNTEYPWSRRMGTRMTEDNMTEEIVGERRRTSVFRKVLGLSIRSRENRGESEV